VICIKLTAAAACLLPVWIYALNPPGPVMVISSGEKAAVKHAHDSRHCDLAARLVDKVAHYSTQNQLHPLS
jgi:hypothetical protein